jgi:beta-glucosidase
MVNFGNYTIENSEVMWGASYLVYAEGIYTGYRYYETRYEDVVLGNESESNFDYAKAVQFPFGYGLSYTEFAWTGYKVTEEDDQFTVALTVENKGTTAGKDVAEIYLQSPYTDYDRENGIEKSAVALVGFAKTGVIPAGGSEEVSITVSKEELKAYDAAGYSTYIVDAGDYYIAAGRNAHDALNNILAAKGAPLPAGTGADGNADLAWQYTVDELDASTYAVSQATSNPISNRFSDVDIATYDTDFKYLSRADWTGTWPKVYADGSWTAPDDFVAALEISYTEDPDAKPPVMDTVDEEVGELSVAMLIGTPYDDPIWDTLLGQMSEEEMDKLVRIGGYATMKIDSIRLPGTEDTDGPAGFSATLVGGEGGMGYPPEIVLASAWNTSLSEEMGLCIGEDSLRLKRTGWYAPGVNIHRAPYSGRNFEYFSEDGLLSGKMSAAVVSGAQSKGTLVYMKHFAVNDQETNRMGGSMMANEQSLRELYLKGFEYTVREGEALGAMVAMNRIGFRWVGGHAGLLTDTLRDEWGFEGVVITDQASFDVFVYEDMREGLEAGTDLWLNTNADLWKLSDAEMTPTVLNNMRKGSKNIVFAIANSNAMNGLSVDSEIVSVMPLWQKLMIGLDIAIGLIIIGAIVLVTKRSRKDPDATPSEKEVS